MRHIFYPTLQLKLDSLDKNAFMFNLNGFHHDENGLLEKSGLFKFFNKIEGPDGIFKADVDFGDGLIHEGKTFFPSAWSREKVAQVIFEASQNRIREIVINNSLQKKFECCGVNNLIIEILFNFENMMISAYPSMKNFMK
ncbi:MAG: EndoU domain-containing protein [Candidatus Chromulinivorax sp.]